MLQEKRELSIEQMIQVIKEEGLHVPVIINHGIQTPDEKAIKVLFEFIRRKNEALTRGVDSKLSNAMNDFVQSVNELSAQFKKINTMMHQLEKLTKTKEEIAVTTENRTQQKQAKEEAVMTMKNTTQQQEQAKKEDAVMSKKEQFMNYIQNMKEEEVEAVMNALLAMAANATAKAEVTATKEEKKEETPKYITMAVNRMRECTREQFVTQLYIQLAKASGEVKEQINKLINSLTGDKKEEVWDKMKDKIKSMKDWSVKPMTLGERIGNASYLAGEYVDKGVTGTFNFTGETLIKAGELLKKAAPTAGKVAASPFNLIGDIATGKKSNTLKNLGVQN